VIDVIGDIGGRAALVGLALLVGVSGQSAPASAGDGRRAGEVCRDVHRYAVRVVEDPTGGAVAVFPLMGGSTEVSLPVSAALAGELLAHPDVHVADVQLGTYEPIGAGGAVACRLDPTYHLYCPARGALDELCIEWGGGQAQPGSPASPARARAATQARTSPIWVAGTPSSPSSRDSTAARSESSGTP
jgi:hypothetical protein